MAHWSILKEVGFVPQPEKGLPVLMIRSPGQSVPPFADIQRQQDRVTGPRIGAVQYLNTRPLIYGLSGELIYDLPSRLADRLAGGDLDVALIPTIELFQGLAGDGAAGGQRGYRIISRACIACRGPVMSVRLFFRTRPERVRTIAVDEGSRTSVAVCRILLAKRFGLSPSLETLPLNETIDQTSADAVLLIGDRAIGPTGGGFQAVWDLGDEWFRSTGLPFVFAVWAARPGVDADKLGRLLDAARDRGEANLAAIAAAEAAGHGLTVPQCLDYLRENLHYDLGPLERRALQLFYREACQLGLAPSSRDLAGAFVSPASLAPGSA